MPRRLKALLLMGMLALAGASAWSWIASQPRWTVAQVRRVLARGTPPGCSPEQVRAFLHADPFRERERMNVGHYDPRDRTLPAILRHTADGVLSYANITLLFHFGKDRKLARVKVQELFTGL